MHRSFVTILMAAALAACGSKSTPATPPVEPMPMATNGSAMGGAEAPRTEAPAKPVEVAQIAPKPDPEKARAELVAAETSAFEKAKPVLDKYCASCHTKGNKKATSKKLAHMDMATYPFGGKHTNSIGNEIRVVLAIDGTEKATMPFDKPGSVKGAELEAIKAWTEAWQAAGKAGIHPAEPAEKD
jgi:hypothetical protein